MITQYNSASPRFESRASVQYLVDSSAAGARSAASLGVMQAQLSFFPIFPLFLGDKTGMSG
jgi:hypothetical protein